MKWNGIDLKFGLLRRLMGLKVHEDGFKPTNSLVWQAQ